MAAHAYPELDVAVETSRLDVIAERVAAPTRDALRRVVFDEAGLRGNADDYYDPENSFINRVLDRGVGIPISLAVVMMAVGRRAGVPLVGINAPSHFLVRDDSDGALLDPFNAGTEVAYVDAPVASPLTVVDRMLNNLRTIYVTRGDITNLLWVLRLRTLLPGAPPVRGHELQRVIARLN
jgi:regulator of sirC expression with transglutaminase-like and TPR domain